MAGPNTFDLLNKIIERQEEIRNDITDIKVVQAKQEENLKECSKCYIKKEYDHFHKSKKNRDGYRGFCKECHNLMSKKWRKNNLLRSRKITSKYQKSFHGLKKRKERENRQYKSDPVFKIIKALRKRLWNILKRKNYTKQTNTSEYIGCSKDYLISHIESQFRDGMNWDNYGILWELDHIKPITKFDLSKKSEQLKVNHYKNLQPLLKMENRKKGNKYEF